jgi:hypothetical protein
MNPRLARIPVRTILLLVVLLFAAFHRVFRSSSELHGLPVVILSPQFFIENRAWALGERTIEADGPLLPFVDPDPVNRLILCWDWLSAEERHRALSLAGLSPTTTIHQLFSIPRQHSPQQQTSGFPG